MWKFFFLINLIEHSFIYTHRITIFIYFYNAKLTNEKQKWNIVLVKRTTPAKHICYYSNMLFISVKLLMYDALITWVQLYYFQTFLSHQSAHSNDTSVFRHLYRRWYKLSTEAERKGPKKRECPLFI